MYTGGSRRGSEVLEKGMGGRRPWAVTGLGEWPRFFTKAGPRSLCRLGCWLRTPVALSLQQPNIKQKFVALLKRFKVSDEVRPLTPELDGE